MVVPMSVSMMFSNLPYLRRPALMASMQPGLAKIQSEAVLTMDGKCIYGFCTNETMEEYGVTKSDLDAVIGAIRNVDGVEVALFVYQLDENKFKASLRSKRYVDVSEIAVSFGGGGHVRAAGFDIEGSLEDVIEKVLKKINNVI